MSLLDDELAKYRSKARWFWAERMGWTIAVGAAFLAGAILF